MLESFVDRYGRTLTLVTEASLKENAADWLALVTTVVECEFEDERLNADDFINSLDRWAQDCMNAYLPTDDDHPVCRSLYRMARKIKKGLDNA